MRTNVWEIFGGELHVLIKQCAALMADTVMGTHDSQVSNFFAIPLFDDREDLAYLQGSRTIKSHKLGPFAIRQLERQFKDALSTRGLSGLEVDIQVARFRVYYWTMTICLTNGSRRQLARKQVKKSRSVVDKLTGQIGGRSTKTR